MDFSFWNNKKCRYGIIGASVLLLTVIALAIRLLPMGDLVGTGDMIAGPDAWYNLRLVEVLLASGGFIFFEPMTLFPTGQDIVWVCCLPIFLRSSVSLQGMQVVSH